MTVLPARVERCAQQGVRGLRVQPDAPVISDDLLEERSPEKVADIELLFHVHVPSSKRKRGWRRDYQQPEAVSNCCWRLRCPLACRSLRWWWRRGIPFVTVGV